MAVGLECKLFTHLQASAPLGQVGVAVDPMQAIHVHRVAAEPLPAHVVALVPRPAAAAGGTETELRVKVDAVVRASLVHKWEVEEVSVVRHVDRRLGLPRGRCQSSEKASMS